MAYVIVTMVIYKRYVKASRFFLFFTIINTTTVYRKEVRVRDRRYSDRKKTSKELVGPNETPGCGGNTYAHPPTHHLKGRYK